MPRFKADELRALGRACFVRVGVPEGEAELVSDHLVESGLLGHDTHSVLRLPQYVNMVRDGVVEPGAELETLAESEFTARLSGGWNFGPVTAAQSVQVALEKIKSGGAMAIVSVRDCNHIARLGRFVAQAAKQNAIAIMVANGHGGDLAVAPFGGRQRRLPTNPLCVGIPTGLDWPLVLDMTTSMTSGGDLRLLRNKNQAAPDGVIINAQGELTTEVEEYYGPPLGAALPLGFPVSGHKGFGLGVMVDILAGTLSGAECSKNDYVRSGNALFIAVLNVEAFRSLSDFYAEVQTFVEYIKSCEPLEGIDAVLLPGENAHRHYLERSRTGLDVDETAWAQIGVLAKELDVVLPQPL